MAIDIHHFKQLNDRWDHAAGDDALRQLAHPTRTLAEPLGGHVARMGGYEFLVLLPKRSELDARSFANQLRRALTKTPEGEPWTISIGLARPGWRNGLCTGTAASRRFALSGKASRTRPCGRIEVVASLHFTLWFKFLAEHAPALPVG
ncbi:MAG: hypothetical protein CMN64_18495 [Sphingobium sp.]|nr:hypothetical protein [Sphingobium sp.]